MPMLPWPVCPLAGHATLGQNVVVGSMLVSSESRWGTYQEEVCLDPHFHCKRTIPRLAVELPHVQRDTLHVVEHLQVPVSVSWPRRGEYCPALTNDDRGVPVQRRGRDDGIPHTLGVKVGVM